jgi:Flp pilus assembly protein TadG
MKGKVLSATRRWLRETQGSVMVEFAILSFVFFLILTGIIDLGHAFYMNHVVTNASREGARYGISYSTNSSGQRISPSSLEPSISSYLLNKYISETLMPADANPQVTVAGPGFTTGNKGDDLEVTVTAVKTWFVLDNFIPTLGEQITLSATTVMKCE